MDANIGVASRKSQIQEQLDLLDRQVARYEEELSRATSRYAGVTRPEPPSPVVQEKEAAPLVAIADRIRGVAQRLSRTTDGFALLIDRSEA